MDTLGKQFKAIGASEMARLAKDACHKPSPMATAGQAVPWPTCAVPCKSSGTPTCAGASIFAEQCNRAVGPFTLHNRTRCTGSFSDTTTTTTVGQCEALCEKTKACDFFTFNPTWAGTHWCWLYSGTPDKHCEHGANMDDFVSGWRGNGTHSFNASSCAKAGCCYQAQPLGPSALNCVKSMVPGCATQ